MIRGLLQSFFRRFPQVEFSYWAWRTRKQRAGISRYQVLSLEETIRLIAQEQKSITRFGDGEFNNILKVSKPHYQANDDRLGRILQDALTAEREDLIVAIPGPLHSLDGEQLSSKYFWVRYLNTHGAKLKSLLHPQRIYGNAGISRFYLGLEDKNRAHILAQQLKTIWEKREVLVVEGEFSRLGVGNDLFANAASLQRILGPSTNAFSHYDAILEAAVQYGKNKLILLALGPTATAMSYDLALHGCWAVDMGHVDVEYMWMLQKATHKIPLEGRFVSETTQQADYTIPEAYRESYVQSILMKIGI